MYINNMKFFPHHQNPLNRHGSSQVMIPVDTKGNKSAWYFRLMASAEYYIEKGWKMCFFTLTYNDWHLPYFPLEAFKDTKGLTEDQFDELGNPAIACFDKVDVQTFMRKVRVWLWNNYKIKKFPWLIASEYGETTHRPHYHGLIFVPAEVTEPLFERLSHFWHGGFVGPKNYNGGYNNGKSVEKPFVCDDIGASIRYVSKYITKDIDFQKTIHYATNIDKSYLRRYGCFHIQQRSLGLEWLDEKNEYQKELLMKQGTPLKWSQNPFNLYQIPAYFNGKIIYDNKYVVDEATGRRHCYREANDFFKQHSKIIFEKKCESLAKMYTDVLAAFSNVKERLQGTELGDLSNWATYQFKVIMLGQDFDSMCKYSTAYNGVRFEDCITHTAEKNRMSLDKVYEHKYIYTGYTYEYQYNLDKKLYADIQDFTNLFYFMLDIVTFVEAAGTKAKEALERESQKIRDYWRNQF